MPRLTVHVTQEDINKARTRWELHGIGGLTNYHRMGECPIAQSIKRMGYIDPWVSNKVSFYDEKGSFYTYRLTKRAERFISDADIFHDVTIEPTTFRLEEL